MRKRRGERRTSFPPKSISYCVFVFAAVCIGVASSRLYVTISRLRESNIQGAYTRRLDELGASLDAGFQELCSGLGCHDMGEPKKCRVKDDAGLMSRIG